MSGKVMVLFDSLFLRDEAVEYSVELAKRMDYSLIILVLLALDSEEIEQAKDFEARTKEALRGPLTFARQAGVPAVAEVRIGNISSELIKFIAGSKSVQTIVWGGYRDAGFGKRNKAHWLGRVKDKLDCPVVVPQRKP